MWFCSPLPGRLLEGVHPKLSWDQESLGGRQGDQSIWPARGMLHGSSGIQIIKTCRYSKIVSLILMHKTNILVIWLFSPIDRVKNQLKTTLLVILEIIKQCKMVVCSPWMVSLQSQMFSISRPEMEF